MSIPVDMSIHKNIRMIPTGGIPVGIPVGIPMGTSRGIPISLSLA